MVPLLGHRCQIASGFTFGMNRNYISIIIFGRAFKSLKSWYCFINKEKELIKVNSHNEESGASFFILAYHDIYRRIPVRNNEVLFGAAWWRCDC